MAEKNRRNKLYYTIAFLVSTSYIWVLIISAYNMGIPQYNSLIYGILLMTAFTFIITVPLLYIGLPLICIGAVLAMFRIFSVKRMLTYYALSWLILWLALEIPLSIYGNHEEKYIFTEQVKEQHIIEKVKEAVEKNNGPIKITDELKQSMLEWNEGTGSPEYPILEIRYELLNCDKQKDEKINGYSCTASIEAHYKQEKWLIDFDSKENAGGMNLSKNNQQAEEKAKQEALTSEEETNIRKNAESEAIQFLKEKYNLNLTLVKQTFEKSINSNKKENRPSNPVHEIKINGYLNEDSKKDVTVRVEYDPLTKKYWSHIYAFEMSDEAQNEIQKQIDLKKEKNN
ncbi:hypothetical protein COE15_11340 [Bacillus cereus]|uniref:hypothetical protein n=2 Tax=unclassified Bacillus (in: firmicutes) TaxID=185979 RepID=UPI00047C3CD8|nr:hypothetical protein [Bacillus sp. UNC437CL72CviS29]PFE02869.1 hypothetical protein CN288_14805 [Bacillus sp. AFS023182]PGY01090.1 hypothetical protein COE15_11340 [Bacillus cereus]